MYLIVNNSNMQNIIFNTHKLHAGFMVNQTYADSYKELYNVDMTVIQPDKFSYKFIDTYVHIFTDLSNYTAYKLRDILIGYDDDKYNYSIVEITERRADRWIKNEIKLYDNLQHDIIINHTLKFSNATMIGIYNNDDAYYKDAEIDFFMCHSLHDILYGNGTRCTIMYDSYENAYEDFSKMIDRLKSNGYETIPEDRKLKSISMGD